MLSAVHSICGSLSVRLIFNAVFWVNDNKLRLTSLAKSRKMVKQSKPLSLGSSGRLYVKLTERLCPSLEQILG